MAQTKENWDAIIDQIENAAERFNNDIDAYLEGRAVENEAMISELYDGILP